MAPPQGCGTRWDHSPSSAPELAGVATELQRLLAQRRSFQSVRGAAAMEIPSAAQLARDEQQPVELERSSVLPHISEMAERWAECAGNGQRVDGMLMPAP